MMPALPLFHPPPTDGLLSGESAQADGTCKQNDGFRKQTLRNSACTSAALPSEASAVDPQKAEIVEAEQPKKGKNMTNTPAYKIRISNISAVIWRNSSDKGNWYSVNLARGYKTDDGWRDTDSMGFDDLLTAAKLLDMAHSWIAKQMEADRKARKESEQAA